MSQTLLFTIGAVIFIVVFTAVFLYGMCMFREWQDRDEDRAGIGPTVDTPSGVSAATAPDQTLEKIVTLDRAPSSGSARPRSAA